MATRRAGQRIGNAEFPCETIPATLTAATHRPSCSWPADTPAAPRLCPSAPRRARYLRVRRSIRAPPSQASVGSDVLTLPQGARYASREPIIAGILARHVRGVAEAAGRSPKSSRTYATGRRTQASSVAQLHCEERSWRTSGRLYRTRPVRRAVRETDRLLHRPSGLANAAHRIADNRRNLGLAEHVPKVTGDPDISNQPNANSIRLHTPDHLPQRLEPV